MINCYFRINLVLENLLKTYTLDEIKNKISEEDFASIYQLSLIDAILTEKFSIDRINNSIYLNFLSKSVKFNSFWIGQILARLLTK